MATIPQPIRIVSRGLKTQVLLPDGTDISRHVRSVRWEHQPGKTPRVFLEFLPAEMDVEAFEQGDTEPGAQVVHRNPALPAGLEREKLRDALAEHTHQLAALSGRFV